MATEDGSERIFYDGDCGLCHGAVRFVLRNESAAGESFRFAPLQGATYASVAASIAGEAPGLDSLVVQTRDGHLLWRSDGVVYILHRLGGRWRRVAKLVALCPRPLRDAAYDLVARLRSRLARKPEGLCPMVPSHLDERFDP